jgi:hypothetical protein
MYSKYEWCTHKMDSKNGKENKSWTQNSAQRQLLKNSENVMYVILAWIFCPYKEWAIWMFSQPKKTYTINRSTCIYAHIMYKL